MFIQLKVEERSVILKSNKGGEYNLLKTIKGRGHSKVRVINHTFQNKFSTVTTESSDLS